MSSEGPPSANGPVRAAAEVAEVVAAGLAAAPLSGAAVVAVLVVVEAGSASTPLWPWWLAALAALLALLFVARRAGVGRGIRFLGLALVFALSLGAYVLLGEVRVEQLVTTALIR
ncbi:MAG TPA: hypothetical protein VGW38_22710 [Chloroflexota bacterium]|nr:hypothetical protein [Chloroflexota bacterium]